MDHHEAGRYWNENAEAWTQLSRAGYDVYRDHLNTPAFLAMLPPIASLHGLDIGCGEGHNTRVLVSHGARMTGVDISEIFLGHARHSEAESPLGIDYRLGSAVELPFPADQFDFAVAFMSLQEFPELELALAEAHRVLKPGGFLQFSIPHPCFDTPHRRNLRRHGQTYAIEVGGYFRRLHGEIDEWTFGAAPLHVRQSVRRFRIPRFTRPLSEWLNLGVAAGFQFERMQEPCPTPEAVSAFRSLQDARVVAYFAQFRFRKPVSA